MDDTDLQIDNILEHKKAKEKVDGKAKGNRVELQLCKLLTDHFGTEFTRAPGSGARGKQVHFLPEHAKKTLSGDICVPEKFKWVFESKGGYEDDIDLTNAMDGDGISRLDEFIKQSSGDAEYCGRKPLICWKRNRKPWLAILRWEDFTPIGIEHKTEYRLHYREWVILSLEKLLEITEKDFWFGKEV